MLLLRRGKQTRCTLLPFRRQTFHTMETKVHTLDKTQFQKTFNLIGLQVPTKLTSKVISGLRDYCWHKTKTVLPSEDNTKRIVLLDSTVPDLASLPEDRRKFVEDELQNPEIVQQTVTIGYEHMSAEEVLKEVVPKELELVTSYEMIGHIAHMNLRDEILPYKNVIGQVILEALRTVVNKTGEINTVFRTFEMEVIAGENDMNAEVHETNCRFQFNFAEVYWNSRLGSEHARMVDLFQPGEVVADMFCGVGPFAVPAAKKGVHVYANDLNPRSFFYLQHNGKLNKCKNFLKCYNMDGRHFMKMLIRESTPSVKINHVVMNLPASAVTFLDVFQGLYDPNTDPNTLPFVHCYGFSNAADPEADILKQAEDVLGVAILAPSIFNVRNVSVGKYMMRITFKLPPAILNTTMKEDGSEDEPKQKKQKVDTN